MTRFRCLARALEANNVGRMPPLSVSQFVHDVGERNARLDDSWHRPEWRHRHPGMSINMSFDPMTEHRRKGGSENVCSTWVLRNERRHGDDRTEHHWCSGGAWRTTRICRTTGS